MTKTKCKHKRTRKLFYMDGDKKTWGKTEYSYCLDCKKIVRMEELK